MIFLDLCAATLRNRHLARPWLKALARGCELASADPEFARTGGGYFGGARRPPVRDPRPDVGARSSEDLALAWPRLLSGAARPGTTLGDLVDWQVGLDALARSPTRSGTRAGARTSSASGCACSRAGRAASDPRFAGVR